MKLSIVVPVYNVEKYLDKCIKSILNQSFKDFELILVDDGSPDKCGEMCDNYMKSDYRVKVIHKKNGGLSSARNAGIKIAKGDYIGFVDSDDWIDKDMYSKMINLAYDNNADIVQCNYTKALDDNDKKSIESENIEILNNIQAIENLYNEKVVETMVTWSKIYKKYLFDEIMFPEGKLHEDKFTTYKLLYKANKIIYMDSQLYYYRQNENSITNRPFSAKRLDALLASEESIKFYKEINNNILYDKALSKYEQELKSNYLKCYALPDNKKYMKDIRQKYKKIILKYAFIHNIKFKTKILNLFFLINPDLYFKIQRKRRKILN